MHARPVPTRSDRPFDTIILHFQAERGGQLSSSNHHACGEMHFCCDACLPVEMLHVVFVIPFHRLVR